MSSRKGAGCIECLACETLVQPRSCSEYKQRRSWADASPVDERAPFGILKTFRHVPTFSFAATLLTCGPQTSLAT